MPSCRSSDALVEASGRAAWRPWNVFSVTHKLTTYTFAVDGVMTFNLPGGSRSAETDGRMLSKLMWHSVMLCESEDARLFRSTALEY